MTVSVPKWQNAKGETVFSYNIDRNERNRPFFFIFESEVQGEKMERFELGDRIKSADRSRASFILDVLKSKVIKVRGNNDTALDYIDRFASEIEIAVEDWIKARTKYLVDAGFTLIEDDYAEEHDA